MQEALVRPHPELIAELYKVLLQTRELLKIDCFDFWIRQIDETPIDEIPTTKYGVECARGNWEDCQISRNALTQALGQTSESVLTYCSNDDVCTCQSDFHYYALEVSGKIFKESELGMQVGITREELKSSTHRIARISELSELSIPEMEWYRSAQNAAHELLSLESSPNATPPSCP